MIKVGTITEDGKNKLTDLDEMIKLESADLCIMIKDSVSSKTEIKIQHCPLAELMDVKSKKVLILNIE